MNAFIKFNKGIMKMPLRWQPWLMLLVTVNFLTPLFFITRLEAQIVLLTFVAGTMLMTFITSISGFTRLLGLGHILWIPLLYFLWSRLSENPANEFFGIWIRVLMILNALSLIIDVIDVVRYISGEREETVQINGVAHKLDKNGNVNINL
ncbi:MAG TPA: hypothetical protein EYQ00_03830, partial [Dehalococcoidia bacterium]|nr:hypothetical protein [Dehalococcoidia bacterium]